MKRIILVLTIFTAIVAMSFAFTDEPPRFKNLKVLPKNINKEEIDSVMKSFTVALGVKCNFCHVFNQEQKAMDFPSDGNKHKEIARGMIKMTQKLNKKYFDIENTKSVHANLQVTCYTCHNGKPEPAKFPSLAQERPRQRQQQNTVDSTKLK
ncbi:MAG: c-type cytochrome [Chitinophagaceae bacterium]